jgi:hypothetical protein
VELYLYSPNTPSWRGAQLKHRDNFMWRMHDVEILPVLSTTHISEVIDLLSISQHTKYQPEN